uniref:Uncharacterized protein n=1 Tax=Salix viminalis TaxID=40686 RepID=A0A6N2M661_SALVM
MRFQRSLALVLPRMRNKFQSQASRYFSSLLESEQRSSFGIAFDIDGVILRGRDPIGGSPQAVRRLLKDSGNLNVPFLFLTNGGGVPESKRANELSEQLGVKILPSQSTCDNCLTGHSPFKSLLKRYENQLIIAAGKGEPAVVMSEYGFKKVVSIDEYASLFENIDPLSEYKKLCFLPIDLEWVLSELLWKVFSIEFTIIL